jgi:hypothetical protein
VAVERAEWVPVERAEWVRVERAERVPVEQAERVAEQDLAAARQVGRKIPLADETKARVSRRRCS